MLVYQRVGGKKNPTFETGQSHELKLFERKKKHPGPGVPLFMDFMVKIRPN